MQYTSTTNSPQLVIREEKTVSELLLSVLRSAFIFLGKKLKQKALRLSWILFKLLRASVILGVIAIIAGLLFVTVNQYFTSYTITSRDGVYAHEDPRTTDILNYLTGKGPLPESERLTLYRQYVKNVLEDAEMEVPENIATMSKNDLDRLTIDWYLKKTPNNTKDPADLRKIIDDLFEKAVKPPLEGFGPEVNSKLWRLLQSVGSPKIRWVEMGDEAASRLVAYSAGDKRAFYDPIDNTIFIRYGDSVNVLLDEAPHSKQFRERAYRSYTRFAYALGSSFLTALKNETQRVYRTQYTDEETFEGEAHGPMKSALLQQFDLRSVDNHVPAKPNPEHVCVVPNPLSK